MRAMLERKMLALMSKISLPTSYVRAIKLIDTYMWSLLYVQALLRFMTFLVHESLPTIFEAADRVVLVHFKDPVILY